jgi:hypothetical protein
MCSHHCSIASGYIPWCSTAHPSCFMVWGLSQHRKWAPEYPDISHKRQTWKKLLLYGLPLSSHKIRSFIFYERVNLAMLPNSFLLQLQLHYQSIPNALCMIGATPHMAHVPQQCLTIIQHNITVKRPGNPTTQALIHVISFCAALCRPNCTQVTPRSASNAA